MAKSFGEFFRCLLGSKFDMTLSMIAFYLNLITLIFHFILLNRCPSAFSIIAIDLHKFHIRLLQSFTKYTELVKYKFLHHARKMLKVKIELKIENTFWIEIQIFS